MKKILSLLAMLMAFTIQVSAQTTIKGTVTDALTSEPLIGATIIEKGTTNGTITDFDGKFSFTTQSEKPTIVVSFIGYLSQELIYSGQSDLNIIMKADVTGLEEVMVVGYGTIKKSHSTGAIAQIKGNDVVSIQAARVDDALAGKLSGVMIQNQSGEPGADPKIQIRAASSISGDSNPLVVVDGFPISGSLATVNPNDIESMEVLKDAASAAIYGSRGANGVILVTTKKGKTGKASISYNGYTSISNKYVKDIEMLYTASEWADKLEAGIADGSYNLSGVKPELLNFRLNAYKNAPDVESMEEWLFKTGNSQSHDISINGGSEDVKVFASLGYLNTDGIAQKQSYRKYNGRMNIDANIGSKITAGLSMNGYYGHQEIVPHDMRDLLRAYSIAPLYHTDASIAFAQALDKQAQSLGLEAFDKGVRGTSYGPQSIYDLKPGDYFHDWHYGRSYNGIGGTGDAGPASKFDFAEQWQKTYFANFSSYIQYSIMDGLNVKTVIGADMRDTRDYYYQGVLADGQQRSNQSDLDQTDVKRSSWLSETTLNYAKTFGNHDIAAVAGLEFQNFYIKGIALSGTNVPVGMPLNYALLSPADIATTQRNETVSRRSVFGRINYAYDNRYLASVSVRRDGDSRFGANNRYETFPAVSLGWNVHNESFYSLESLSNLKLRFSRGSLGTTSFLGSYDALSLLSPQTTIFGTGFLIPSNVANPDLTWQSNTETNYGINLGLKDNRYTLGVDYYTSDIQDMLINQSVSEVLGTSSIVLNRGDVRSSGIELELGAIVLQKKDLVWKVNANFSTVNTEITSLGGLDELPQVVYGGPAGRGPIFRNYVGGEIGEMWGLEVIREVETKYMLDPSRNIGFGPSEYYVVDQNNDGVINNADYVKLGVNTPDFYWGLNSQFSYKNFDMSLQFQGSQGGEVYNIDPLYWKSEFGGRLQASFDANKDGKGDESGLFYTQTRNAHGALIQDASYTALRNLTLGYTLKPELVSKAGIGSARIYIAATNLLYLMADNYTSFNPEGVETTNDGYLGPTTYGYQEGASPIVRSFTLGLNVNF